MSATHCTLAGPYDGPDSMGFIYVTLDRGPGLSQLRIPVRMSSPCVRGVGGRSVPRLAEVQPVEASPPPAETPEPDASPDSGEPAAAKDGRPGGPDETWSLEQLQEHCDGLGIKYHHWAKEKKLLELIREHR